MHRSIADFILDLVQNSWEAGAGRIEVDIHQDAEGLSLEVRDDGKGMDAQEMARALDPFYSDGIKHPHRRVGLGLPFLQQTLEGLGQTLGLESAKGKGTAVRCRFPFGHIDCPPLGDVVGTLVILFRFEGDHELVVHRHTGELRYVVSRKELVEVLGELETAGSAALLRTYLESLEEDHGENEP